MTLRAAQLVRSAAAIVLIAAGAFASTGGFTSATLERSPGAAAYLAQSGAPVAQAAIAHVAVLKGDYPAAIAPARRSLAARPLHPPTMRSLAIAQLETGDHDGAAKTLTLASQLGWRDAATQTLLLDIAIRSGDSRAAAIRLDALARQRQEVQQLKVAMRLILFTPGGPEALAERLAASPVWRDEYVQATDILPVEAYGPWMEMLAALEGEGAAPRPAEYAAFERTLIARGQVQQAIAASRKFGALRRSGAAGFGVIEQGANVSPFVWSVAAGREASVSQARRGAFSARVDGQIGGELVQRVFPIGPGPHRIEMQVDEASNEVERALRWTVTCLPSGALLDPVIRQRPGPDGRIDEIAFVAPAGCEAARIALSSASGQVRADYTLAVSNFRLD